MMNTFATNHTNKKHHHHHHQQEEEEEEEENFARDVAAVTPSPAGQEKGKNNSQGYNGEPTMSPIMLNNGGTCTNLSSWMEQMEQGEQASEWNKGGSDRVDEDDQFLSENSKKLAVEALKQHQTSSSELLAIRAGDDVVWLRPP
jgi:hypothetical protein